MRPKVPCGSGTAVTSVSIATEMWQRCYADARTTLPKIMTKMLPSTIFEREMLWRNIYYQLVLLFKRYNPI